MSEPKFRVGDRWRRLVPSRHELSDGGKVPEDQLELAPPLPRATVQFLQFIGTTNASGAWIVSVGGDMSGPYRTREQADYIAAGLNANPSWSL